MNRIIILRYLLLILFFSFLYSQENFTIIGLPDTQYYTSNLYGGTPQHFFTQTQWIVDNKDSLNIVFVAHLGDCVQNGDAYEIEWQRADTAMQILEDSLITMSADGIPYGIAVGNHDNMGVSGQTVLYNQYFGENRFLDRLYYGGHYETKNDQHYALFNASGYDFIAIFLEYNEYPEDAVLVWADSLLTVHSTRRAIIISHYIINDGNPGSWSTQGRATYDALKSNPNLFLMICGHADGEGMRQDTYNGNTVYTLLSNYQSYPNGGNGFLRIMEFLPANNEIQIKTYSPYLEQFETDTSSQFILSYDMPLLITPVELLPVEFTFHQNYPNPFNPVTTLQYDLPEDAMVNITIYDMMGRVVGNLVSTQQNAGYKSIQWSATNNLGESVSAGLYLYTIQAGDYTQTKKMVLLK
jgi:hypothetical protein